MTPEERAAEISATCVSNPDLGWDGLEKLASDAIRSAEDTAYRVGALEMLEACIKIIIDPVGDGSGGYWLSYANRQLVEGLMRSLPLPNIPDFQKPAAVLGRKGGQSTSKAKQEAAKKNGKKGGRPKKQVPHE